MLCFVKNVILYAEKNSQFQFSYFWFIMNLFSSKRFVLEVVHLFVRAKLGLS